MINLHTSLFAGLAAGLLGVLGLACDLGVTLEGAVGCGCGAGSGFSG